MKKLFGLFGIFVLLATMVSAGDEVIMPQVAGMSTTDTVNVEVCVTDRYDQPFPGVALTVVCKGANLNLNEACDVAEDGNTAEFDVTVLNDGLTDADGCEDVQLKTIGATFSEYTYRISADQVGDVTGNVAAETGFAVVPEFATIGAALALAGAGLYIFKKRK